MVPMVILGTISKTNTMNRKKLVPDHKHTSKGILGDF